MANEFDSLALEAILAPQTQALQTIAMRPQKSQTTTTSTSTPYALKDLVATRNRIGESTRALDDALKARETFGYTLANALAGAPQQQGAGSWLSDFARGFGGGLSMPTNLAIDRAQKKYEAEMKDLADILAFDKAMGETQTQKQVIDYKEMPWSGTGGKTVAQGGDDGLQRIRQEISGQSLADAYKTISENPLTFSNLAPIYQDANSRALKSGIDQIGVQNLGRAEFQYLSSIMPKGFSGAINTAKEQELMRPLTTAFKEGTGTAKTSAITNFYGSLYDEYATQAAAQGINMPISKQEYINSRLSKGKEFNPAYFAGQSKDMYKNIKKTQDQNANVGFIVNGYRFKGGDVHDKNNWEAVK